MPGGVRGHARTGIVNVNECVGWGELKGGVSLVESAELGTN